MIKQQRLKIEAPLPEPEESDEVLMVRVAEGDVESYEKLYHRYKNRILTFIHRYVGDRDWAEDLTHETFLKLYKNPQAFDPRNRFVTWLFTVARNLSIDFLRRRRPTSGLTVSDGDDQTFTLELPDSTHQSPQDAALIKELEENIQGTLNSLSDKLREVFILCAIQGLSYEEVANIVGCPAKTVSSRLSRARKRFLKSFHPYLSGKKQS
ncbi:MAG: RNA polymerase sigma-70 factor (ECF subfamily) [Planctomycetota bacterium]|jgi:RNA polymerase sigma-70 factor (ECF subfamily)